MHCRIWYTMEHNYSKILLYRIWYTLEYNYSKICTVGDNIHRTIAAVRYHTET